MTSSMLDNILPSMLGQCFECFDHIWYLPKVLTDAVQVTHDPTSSPVRRKQTRLPGRVVRHTPCDDDSTNAAKRGFKRPSLDIYYNAALARKYKIATPTPCDQQPSIEPSGDVSSASAPSRLYDCYVGSNADNENSKLETCIDEELDSPASLDLIVPPTPVNEQTDSRRCYICRRHFQTDTNLRLHFCWLEDMANV